MKVMLDTNIFISMIFLELPFELVYTPKALDLGIFLKCVTQRIRQYWQRRSWRELMYL